MGNDADKKADKKRRRSAAARDAARTAIPLAQAGVDAVQPTTQKDTAKDKQDRKRVEPAAAAAPARAKASQAEAEPQARPSKRARKSTTKDDANLGDSRPGQDDAKVQPPSFLARTNGNVKIDAELDALFAAAPAPPAAPADDTKARQSSPASQKASNAGDTKGRKNAEAKDANRKVVDVASSEDSGHDVESDEDDDEEDTSDDEEETDAGNVEEEGEGEEDDEQLSSLGSGEYEMLYEDDDAIEADAAEDDASPSDSDGQQEEESEKDTGKMETDSDEDGGDTSGEEEDEDASRNKLVHETLQKPDSKDSKLAARRQREGDDEPHEIKDRRTIFIGNVPIDALKSKALRKALRRHIESFSPVPGLVKTSAIRFRSVPFSVMTDSVDMADDSAGANKARKQRERGQLYKEVARQLDNEEGRAQGKVYLNAKQKRKVAAINQDLNTNASSLNAYVAIQPPKLSLVRTIWGEHRAEALLAQSVNAPVLAALVAVCANGSVFEGRHLRTDVVAPMDPADVVAAGLDKLRSPIDGSLLLVGHAHTSAAIDVKRTVFVGNLDFAADEEELRSFFEKMVSAERGPPPPLQRVQIQAAGGASFSSKASTSKKAVAPPASLAFSASAIESVGEWVADVRLVRDRATQMGKGFGYVRFVDAACVEEVLALHEAEEAYIQALKSGRAVKALPKKTKARGKKGDDDENGNEGGAGEDDLVSGASRDTYRRRFKFKTRPLRVTRCKTVGSRHKDASPSGARQGQRPGRPGQGRPGSDPRNGAPSQAGHKRTPTHIGKAWPPPNTKASSASPSLALSTPEYASLPKDERAAIKRADPARTARRMEKKLAKKQALRKGGDGDDDEGPKARVKLAQGKSIKKAGGKKAGSASGHKKVRSSVGTKARRVK